MPIFPIGVQQILPRAYTRWKAPKDAPHPPADADAEGDQAPPKPEQGQSPAPEPRSGHILDTIA